MVSVTCLLVLACAVAANALALQQGDANKCSTAQYGSTIGYPIALSEIFLSPATRDWRVTVPISVCSAGVAGEVAQACDTDSAPILEFETESLFLVHRTGNLQGYGNVHVTVYCNYPNRPQGYGGPSASGLYDHPNQNMLL